MLLLLKQSPTGIFAYPPETPENEIHTAIYFDTISQTIYTSGTVGGGTFELATHQRVWTNPVNGNTYFYDGSESVYMTTGTPPAAQTYSLILSTKPKGSTLPILNDATNTAPYTAGESVSIEILPGADEWLFINWSLGTEVISLTENFIFRMPAADVDLVANFEYVETPTIPGPEPEPSAPFVQENYYPLELRVKGVQIPLTNLTSKLNTGIFSDDLIGEYNNPINIPITEAIMVALNLPNDPQSSWNFANPIPAELWAHGNRRYRGHLDILEADGQSIRTTFVLDSGFFIQKNKDTSIRACYSDSDIINLDLQVFAVGGYELRFNYDNLTLTINNYIKLFLKATYKNHLEMLEGMYDYLLTLPFNLEVKIEYSEDLTDESSKIIYWDTNIVTTTELKRSTGSRYTRARRLTNKRMDMDDFNLVNEANRIAFPSVYNRELYEGNNQLHDGIVNRYDSQGRMYFGNISYQTFADAFRWQHAIIPFIYLTDVVKKIFSSLNIEVTGDFFFNDRVKRMLLYNNHTLDYIQIYSRQTQSVSRRTVVAIHQGTANPDQENLVYENIHDFNIKLKNHVPDYPIIEFLKSVKNYFAIKYDFNIIQNKVEIRFIRDIIRSMVTLDMTAKASNVYSLAHSKETGFSFEYDRKDPILQDGQTKGLPDPDFTVTNYLGLDSLDAEIEQIAFVRSLRAYFQLTANQDKPPFWKLYAFSQQDDHNSSNSTKKRKWSIGLVPLVDAYYDGKKMPSIEMTANSPAVNLKNEDCGLRIFAFYGRQEDANNRPYSFASCTRYNAKEVLSSLQYDLDIRSEDSYPFWKDIENIYDRAKKFSSTILLNETDIQELSRTRRIRIGNIDYLIDEMEIAHTSGEYAIAKVTMYKIKFTVTQA